jgi:triphosphoribosyl-dephospho-CoA synthase
MSSATVSAPVIANPIFTVGERILQSVHATHQRVACNTNLGVILLIAPIINALFKCYQADKVDCIAKSAQNKTLNNNYQYKFKLVDIRHHIQNVMSDLTVDDAKRTAEAIQFAKPAGLGNVATYDVNAPIKATLYTLMEAAENRDMIAYQYTHGYKTIVDEGLKIYIDAFTQFQNKAWATTALYLHLLSNYPDSHIMRKYGQDTANVVLEEAKPYCDEFWQASNPKRQFASLLKWDSALKSRRINPGTTADLTVAILFTVAILD